MSKRPNPFHVARKGINKANQVYSQKRKKYEDSESYDLTDYVIRDNLRFVKPYYFSFKSFVKGRWVGSSIREVYRKEFRGESDETLSARFEAGHIMVNGAAVKGDHVLKNNDFIEAKIHRHEMPVKADDIEIIEQDDDFLVVNKPASIPIHPAGRFRYNSLLFILAKEKKITGLSTVHRLDRLTSGCLIFGKNQSIARKCFEALSSRQVSKHYIAGVHGNFPHKHIVCEAPISDLCKQIGIHMVSHSTGVKCVTAFDKVCFDDEANLSIVLCRPLTGRTHQIRVHTQYLGNPVVNDPLYNTEAWGSNKGKGVEEFEEGEKSKILQKLREEHGSQNGMEWRDKMKFAKKKIEGGCGNDGIVVTPTDGFDEKTSVQGDTRDTDPICEECGIEFEDPPLSQLEIYLHAYKYEILDRTFVAPLPHWAEKYRDKITSVSIEPISMMSDNERSNLKTTSTVEEDK